MSAGKGDSPRNCFSDTFRDNHDHIFRRPKERDQKELVAFIDSLPTPDTDKHLYKDWVIDRAPSRQVQDTRNKAQAFGSNWDRIFSKEKASKAGTNTPLIAAEKQKGLPNENLRKHR